MSSMESYIRDYMGNVLFVGDTVARAVKYGSGGAFLETRTVESVDDGRLVLEREPGYDGKPSKLGKNTAACDPKKCILLERAT